MDVLADMLAVTQVGHSILAQTELLAPWGFEIDSRRKTIVHIVGRGSCWLILDGREPIPLLPGDVVMVTRGVRHALADDPRSAREPYERVVAKLSRRRAMQRCNHGASTILLCAAYEFELDGPRDALALLPPFIHQHTRPSRHDEPLGAVVRLLMGESLGARPGSTVVVARLVDTLFALVIRGWLEGQPAAVAGYLGALHDRRVGHALSLIHAHPASRWTVEQLAQEAALSRAAFARRFTDLVGEPPLTYVTRWRMRLASKILRATDSPIESVAQQVGYESAPAFAKAFRRHFRTSPGQYRAGRTTAAAATFPQSERDSTG